MTIVKPTLLRVMRIWFSISIRAIAMGLASAIVASILISLIAFATGGGDEMIKSMARYAGVAIGLPVSVIAAYSQLGRKCGDVRLVLISAE